MPHIAVKLSQAQPQERVDALCTGITQSMHAILDKRLEVTAVSVDIASHWRIGNQPAGCTAFVDAKITAGTNTAEQKAAWIDAVWQLLRTQLGELNEVSYIVLHEIGAGDWGYSGLTQAERLAEHPVRSK